jgi:hypothetical protein
MHSELSRDPLLLSIKMENLLPKTQCDTCSTTFEDIDELASHKLSHPTNESTEGVESKDLAEEQRNDHANDLANRTQTENYRGNFWEVNPDQTPKVAKTIRPIDSV